MKQYPLFMPLAGRSVVITGGGANALRKARLVLAAEADVTLISPDIDERLVAEIGAVAALADRAPSAGDFDGAAFAIIADEDPDDQARHAALARAAGCLVNVVDQPALCDFTTPSIIDRGNVVVAISTNGKAPVYGRQVRARLEAMLPANLDRLITFADRFRPAVKAGWGERTRNFWERFFSGPVAQQVLAGDESAATEAMLSLVNQPADSPEGVVHIVGAGPGDPELLTLKAHRLLQEADVILYDRLVGGDILALARRDAERLFVGKARANHAVPQEEIHTRMIALARAGKTVVRLKGGDPFVFGRGGEELEALEAAGISVTLTPGITAATGCAASAAMPLTHRDHTQAVTFVTGHAKGDGEPDLDWQALARLKHTLVIYMGVARAETIRQRLIEAGLAPATPVAILENGTRPNEKIRRGQLQSLHAMVIEGQIKGPALIVIGTVAALARETLVETLERQAA